MMSSNGSEIADPAAVGHYMTGIDAYEERSLPSLEVSPSSTRPGSGHGSGTSTPTKTGPASRQISSDEVSRKIMRLAAGSCGSTTTSSPLSDFGVVVSAAALEGIASRAMCVGMEAAMQAAGIASSDEQINALWMAIRGSVHVLGAVAGSDKNSRSRVLGPVASGDRPTGNEHGVSIRI